jgi:hypothetical protein
MKKLILLVVVTIGFAMISCGTKSSTAKVAKDSTQVTQNGSVKVSDTLKVTPVIKLDKESKIKK